jgi:hypothetical protein
MFSLGDDLGGPSADPRGDPPGGSFEGILPEILWGDPLWVLYGIPGGILQGILWGVLLRIIPPRGPLGKPPGAQHSTRHD